MGLLKIARCAGPLFLSLLFLSPTGCTTVRPGDVREAAGLDTRGEKGAFINDVPFFAQDELMCGPAALASVLNYYGREKGLEEVSLAVYHPGLKGSLSMDLLIYAKEQGFEALFYRGGLEDLKERLRQKTPVIVFINLGYEFYPVGHYMVVLGYNDEMEVVVAHSGTSRARVISYRAFLDDWEKTGFSTLVVRPKVGP